MKRIQKGSLAAAFAIMILALAGCGGSVTTPLASGPVDLSTLKTQVRFQRGEGGIQAGSTLKEEKLDENDAVTVDASGRANLRFEDYLVVDIYRDSDLRIEGLADPKAPPAYRLRLEGGTINGAMDAQQLAGKHVQPELRIDTKWAVIRDVDTVFIVYYDKTSEQTWVVVKRGTMSVEAGGKKVIVKGGQQTWVEPGQPPIDPIPACRNLVESRFPLIDNLTNNVLPDLDWLCTDSAMLGSPAISTPLPPTSTVGPPPTKAPTATPRPPTSTPPPTLTPYANFIADPASIQACACTTLRWDAGNVASVAIDGAPVPAQGSRQECPSSSSTTYNLRAATSAGAVIDRSASVQVVQPSINFRADSTSLSYPGECTILRWDVDNVKAVYLDGQGVAGHDSRQVCPRSTTTYNLRTNTACADINRSVTIQAAGDVTGPAISNVTVSNDITFSGYQNLCVNSNLGISTIITDPAGVDLVVATGIREECLPGQSDYDICGSDNFELPMEIHGFAEADRFFTWGDLKFGGEGKLTFRIKARDRFGNQSETSIFTYPVKYCYNIE